MTKPKSKSVFVDVKKENVEIVKDVRVGVFNHSDRFKVDGILKSLHLDSHSADVGEHDFELTGVAWSKTNVSNFWDKYNGV